MAGRPQSFAGAAPGVQSARAPAGSPHPFRDCPQLRVYTGRLVDSEGDFLLVTLASGANQFSSAFVDAVVTWESSRIESLATVARHGGEPRPWAALDVSGTDWSEQIAGSLPVGDVTAVLEDAAEAFHVLARQQGQPLPSPAHVRLDERTPSATVVPPLELCCQDLPDEGRRRESEPSDASEPERVAVKRLGILGYELLGGESPPTDETTAETATTTSLAQSCVADDGSTHRTVQVIDRALAGGYRSPYELKRALLFGGGDHHRPSSETVDTGAVAGTTGAGSGETQQDRHAESDSMAVNGEQATAQSEEAESPEPVTRGDADQQVVGRRKAVGLLGFGLFTAGGVFAFRSTLGDGEQQAAGSGDDVQIPDATFEFEADPGAINIKHADGDRIEAGRLLVRRPQVSGVDHRPWSAYPGFTERSAVRVGDAITVERGIPMGVSMVWDRPNEDELVILDEFPER